MGPNQKVFRLHIHALIHQRIIPREEASLHQLHVAHRWHRVCVHEFRILDQGLADTQLTFLLVIAFVIQMILQRA